MIEFGNPITVPAELIEKFEQGGSEKREACGTLLDNIYYGLKSVTVNAPNDQTLMVGHYYHYFIVIFLNDIPICGTVFFSVHR